MEIRLLKPAQAELDDGIIYFEEQVSGLGMDFLDEILETFKRIKCNPDAWPLFQSVHEDAWFTDFRMELFTRSGNMKYSSLPLLINTESRTIGGIELIHERLYIYFFF